MNTKIAKKAAALGLKITKYEGFARGGWGTGDEDKRPAGMWVFSVEPDQMEHGEEPVCVCAENLTEALSQMDDAANDFLPN